jgi:patatin-like phospholipase/acyl hydrolase
MISKFIDKLKIVAGPKYNGKYLHSVIQKILGQLRLHDTITNVVIPTFDIRILQPTIFSNFTVQILFSYTMIDINLLHSAFENFTM